MTRMRAAVIAAVGLAALARVAAGQTFAEPGTLACTRWTALRQSGATLGTEQMTGWVQGYFAGAEDLGLWLAQRQQLDAPTRAVLREGFDASAHLLPADDIPQWLDAYCATQATATVRSLLIQLLRRAYQADR